MLKRSIPPSRMLASIIGKFDIFYKPVHLNVNSKHKLTTNAGTVLTVIVIVITLVQSLATISSIFDRTNPMVSIQQEVLQDPGYLQLNSSNFVFAITVQDAGFNLSSSYVSFQMQYRIYTRFPNGTVVKNNTNVPLKKCDPEYMSQFKVDFEKFGIGNALCPSIQQYDLVGTFLADTYHFIKLTAYSCMNDTSQPDIVCKPYDDVMKALTGSTVQVQIFFSNTIFTPTNYSVPISHYMSNLYWNTLAGQQTTNSDIFVNEQVIVTDDNIWLSDMNSHSIISYQIDPSEERPQASALETVDEHNYVLANLYFRKSANKYSTYRTFPKIQQGLVSVGGIFSLCVGVFGTLALFYTKQQFSLIIANEMYEFDLEGPSNGKPTRRCCRRKYTTKSTNRIANLNDSTINLAARMTEKNAAYNEKNGLDLYVEKFAKYSSNNRRQLKYTFFDFMVGLLCCRKRYKDRLVAKATGMVARDIDILQILKKLQETDKLKRILLNEHQNNIFSYSRPPLVTLKEPRQNINPSATKNPSPSPTPEGFRRRGPRKKTVIKRSDQLLESQQEYDDLHKFAKLFQSYQQLIKSKNQSPLNDKILKILDFEMDQTLFDLMLETRSSSQMYAQLIGIKIFADMLEKKRTKKSRRMNKLEAAELIAKKWKENWKIRRALQNEPDPEKRKVIRNQTLLKPHAQLVSTPQTPNETVLASHTDGKASEGLIKLNNNAEENFSRSKTPPLERYKSTDMSTISGLRRKESRQNSLILEEGPSEPISIDRSSHRVLLNTVPEKPYGPSKRKPKRLEPIRPTKKKERTPSEPPEINKKKNNGILFDEFTRKEAIESAHNSFDHIFI